MAIFVKIFQKSMYLRQFLKYFYSIFWRRMTWFGAEFSSFLLFGLFSRNLNFLNLIFFSFTIFFLLILEIENLFKLVLFQQASVILVDKELNNSKAFFVPCSSPGDVLTTLYGCLSVQIRRMYSFFWTKEDLLSAKFFRRDISSFGHFTVKSLVKRSKTKIKALKWA